MWLLNSYRFGVEGLGNGYLYNWFAISNINFAPIDWKVPDNLDYSTLADYLGGAIIAGGQLKESGFTHWDSPNTDATNSSGFTALGSGYRAAGGFSTIKTLGWLGTKEEDGGDPSEYYVRLMSKNNGNFSTSGVSTSKIDGTSIRLLYTGVGTPTTMTDYDGNIYDVVKIGSQYWSVQNWKCSKLNEGTALTKVISDVTWAAAGATDYYYCAYDNDESNV